MNKNTCYKVYYDNGAIISFYQISDGTFKRLVNYTDCKKCQGLLKRNGYTTLKRCECSYRFYDDMSPTNKLEKAKSELRAELKQLEKDYQKIVKSEIKEIKANHPELNNRKKSSKHTINRMISDKYLNSDISKLHRKKLKDFWSLSVDNFPVPKITKINGINLDKWYTIDKIYAGAYNSQGYGAHKYTKGALMPIKAILDTLGIESHIIDTGAYYELICPEKLDKKDLNDLDTMSLEDRCQYFWNRGINPRVYYPFLPYEKKFEYGQDKTI